MGRAKYFKTDVIWGLPENSNLFLNPKGECSLLLNSRERESPTFPRGNRGSLLRAQVQRMQGRGWVARGLALSASA